MRDCIRDIQNTIWHYTVLVLPEMGKMARKMSLIRRRMFRTRSELEADVAFNYKKKLFLERESIPGPSKGERTPLPTELMRLTEYIRLKSGLCYRAFGHC